MTTAPARRSLRLARFTLTAAAPSSSRHLRTRGPVTSDLTTPPPPPPLPSPAVHLRRMRTIESMPFQTYQLALSVIRQDRGEKLAQIKAEQGRLATVIKYKGLKYDSREVVSMNHYLAKLKVKADINSPRVKYNFDTGIIGMNKPVYRHLLEKKWRAMRRPVLMQRLTQMHVIPDVLPGVDPTVDVQVRFRGRAVRPGVVVKCTDSERRPTVKIVPFRQGVQLCTIVVVDPDVPDVPNDAFRHRLHYIHANIPVSPLQTQALGTGADPTSSEIVPWLPPHVQKGSPYHRYALFVFRQRDNARIDPEPLVGGRVDRETFNLRAWQGRWGLKTIGAFMWRGVWDEGTKEVMVRNGIEGWDVMFTRVKS